MEARIRAERRRRIRRWALVLLVAGTMGYTGTARAAGPPAAPSPAVPGQALVRFAPGTAGGARDAVHAALGTTVIRRIPVIGYDVVAAPGVPAEALVALYRAQSVVAVAEPNVTGRIALSPSDACHASPCDGVAGQWHHLMTNTPFGWGVFPGRVEAPGPDAVTIAVLDTKIDQAHPDWGDGARQLDLAGARDFIGASRFDGAARYHGTFVAGLAAAATGNGIDTAGVGYAARILPLTVVDGSGTTDAATLADAIMYAHRTGARVINLSLGLSSASAAVRDAIRAVSADALVVAAAGNNTGEAPFYPGSWPETMSVAGTDAADRPAPCSNHNANVSVSAPADRLIGLQHLPGRLVQAPCGTSAAAPQVSGLAALLFMQDPARTPAQVRRIIERSADDLGPAGRDDRFGHGRINIARALSGGGPRVSDVVATVVAARGGTTTVTATVDRVVERAQVIIGAPGAARVPMRVTGRSVSASVSVPAQAAGPVPIWVRTRDASGWGEPAVGVLGIDGRAPSIWGTSTSESVRALGKPLTVTFALGDDWATTFTHAIEVRSTLTGTVVHRETRTGTAGGQQTYEWLPGLEIPGGHYSVRIGAADEVGNVATVELGALVA